MLTEKEAKEIAHAEILRSVEREILENPRNEPVILDEETIMKPYGWVFSYNSRAYLATRDAFDGLIGNGPIVVEHSGRIHHLGTHADAEVMLRELEAERGLRG